MNIGFVILGIGAGLILIIGVFVWFNNFAGPRKSRKVKESKTEETPKPAPPTTSASRANRMTMNLAGLSADGPPIPGASGASRASRASRNRPRNNSRNESTQHNQTVLDLANLQTSSESQPAAAPSNMTGQQQQMPYFFPPYMMNMPPASDANGSQVNTPQMAHMPNGFPPMPYPPHPMWMGFNMPPMPGNYNMSMSMPASPTQLHNRSDAQRNQSRSESSSQRNESSSQRSQSSSNRRTRNRQQSVYQQPSNYLEDGRMPPELANTNRPQSNRYSTMPPPPSYNEIERDMVSRC
ncbi:hypothetical protein LPJ79_003807 [Coemansia sp. RSA 1821]|nr:hypothetical protein LPJ79_003807 [Coemansia sp. RSA 1821]